MNTKEKNLKRKHFTEWKQSISKTDSGIHVQHLSKIVIKSIFFFRFKLNRKDCKYTFPK